MRFGRFDDERGEYVIERPDTPRPWINYLGSRDYFALISQTGAGFSFFRDARLRRLIRYRHNDVPTGAGGRYLYVRDNADGRFWSPTWQPVQADLEAYECRHGMGYTVIASRQAGIGTVLRTFVPLEAPLEVWEMTLTNRRATPADLSVFSCVEFCLWDALDDQTNFQRNYNTGEVEVDGSVVYHTSEYRERRNHFAYFACSEPVEGYDTQRDAFLGLYGSWSRPQAVVAGRSGNSIAAGWSPVGSHHVRLSMDAGEARTILFVLGYHENADADKFDPPDSDRVNKRSLLPLLTRYLDPQAVEKEFSAVGDHWRGLLENFQIETPDVHTDRMVNRWNAYQCMVTFHLARSASMFESGIGRGIGFRDSNQDLLGVVHMAPAKARSRLLDLAATQLPDGGAFHQYQPLTGLGNDAIGSGFHDDPLWLILSAAAYIKETGDFAVVDEPVPFQNRSGSERPLFEHLERSLRYTLARLGPHGLPLIGRADWNDCLNLNSFSRDPGTAFQTVEVQDGKVAESVFIAGLFVLAAREMADLAASAGREGADTWRRAADEMQAGTLDAGWDGAWFRRAYDAEGRPVGSSACDEGRIYIEPQGMCVLAGIGLNDGRAERALASVWERLATPHGLALLTPAYARYRLELGEISSYPPGYKENGGIFCHTNPWVTIAEARLGHGDRAFDSYARINPSRREDRSEVHGCEPYVYAQMIAGPEAPTHGEAKNSWLTGTAAWSYVAVTQWILGIRPTYRGLRVAPVLPGSWPGYTARRTFRGAVYRIRVRREGAGNSVSLTVDGRPIEGDVVPPSPPGREVIVEVVLA